MRVYLELSVGVRRACWHIWNLLNSNGKDYLCNESYFPSVCLTLSPSGSLLPQQILKTFNLYSKYLILSYNNILKVTNILISKERCPELNFSTLTNYKFNLVTARCINTFSQTCVVCIYKKNLRIYVTYGFHFQHIELFKPNCSINSVVTKLKYSNKLTARDYNKTHPSTNLRYLG